MDVKETVPDLQLDSLGEVFPTIIGKNLNKKIMNIPGDYSDKNLIAIVAFQRWHQDLVDESIENLECMKLHHTHFIIEVPVLQQFSRLRQMRLDGIMRAGIRDREIRQRTVTVYLDKEEFRAKLKIPNEDTIHWFVVDHASKSIIMKGTGVVSQKDVHRIDTITNH